MDSLLLENLSIEERFSLEALRRSVYSLPVNHPILEEMILDALSTIDKMTKMVKKKKPISGRLFLSKPRPPSITEQPNHYLIYLHGFLRAHKVVCLQVLKNWI